jgi:hypothetical protein
LEQCTATCLFSLEYHAGALALRDTQGLYLAPLGSKVCCSLLLLLLFLRPCKSIGIDFRSSPNSHPRPPPSVFITQGIADTPPTVHSTHFSSSSSLKESTTVIESVKKCARGNSCTLREGGVPVGPPHLFAPLLFVYRERLINFLSVSMTKRVGEREKVGPNFIPPVLSRGRMERRKEPRGVPGSFCFLLCQRRHRPTL